METETIKKLMFVLTFCICLFLVANALYIEQHENAHYQINRYYGLDSKIQYSAFMLDGLTIPENKSVTDNNYYTAHSLNEVIGYNIQGIMFILIVMTGVILWKK